MTERAQNGMTCSQFEALLADALDAAAAGAGLEIPPGAAATVPAETELTSLPAELRKAFAAHRQSCPDCGPMYAETRRGMRLMRELVEVDPPRNLVHNILAVTSGIGEKSQARAEARASRATGRLERMRTRFVPSFGGVLRSRFAASFCMAFFSLSLTLSLTGVKISEITYMASHPSQLRKSVELEYSHLQARVLSYYDNMRLVYEVQNRVRELKKAAAPVQTQTEDKGTGQPDQQNLIRPVPGVPDLKEVVQPQRQNAYSPAWNEHSLRRLTTARRARRLPDLQRRSAFQIAQSMSNTQGVQL